MELTYAGRWDQRVLDQMRVEGAEGTPYLVAHFVNDPTVVQLHGSEEQYDMIVRARVRVIRREVVAALRRLTAAGRLAEILDGVYAVVGDWFHMGRSDGVIYINGKRAI